MLFPKSRAQREREETEEALRPKPKPEEVNSFEHEGMAFKSVMTEEWWEVRFYLPGREKEIGMRRERHTLYPLKHVEEAAKEMAIRIKPRFDPTK